VIKLLNFREEEFTCKCGCGFNNVKDTFLWKLQRARTEAQIPFVVVSGCRCAKHNKEVGGAKDSDHLMGEAADIRVVNSYERWKVIFAGYEAGFRRIGVAKGFIHLGDNWTNPQQVLWVY